MVTLYLMWSIRFHPAALFLLEPTPSHSPLHLHRHLVSILSSKERGTVDFDLGSASIFIALHVRLPHYPLPHYLPFHSYQAKHFRLQYLEFFCSPPPQHDCLCFPLSTPLMSLLPKLLVSRWHLSATPRQRLNKTKSVNCLFHMLWDTPNIH